jgi:hypothetical protein
MTSAALDTLAYAKRLRDAGVPVAQAEAHAEAARDFVSGDLATKADVVALQASGKADLAELKAEISALKSDLGSFRADVDQRFVMVDQKLQALEQRLIVKLGAMLVVGVAVLGTIFRLT